MTSARLTELEVLAMSGKHGPKSNAIRELVDEVRKLQQRRYGNSNLPKLSQVVAYAEEIGLQDPEAFFDHHEKFGWQVRGRKIVSWQAAARQWKRNLKGFPANGKSETSIGSRYGVG